MATLRRVVPLSLHRALIRQHLPGHDVSVELHLRCRQRGSRRGGARPEPEGLRPRREFMTANLRTGCPRKFVRRSATLQKLNPPMHVGVELTDRLGG
jgi:hypothetical protein